MVKVVAAVREERAKHVWHFVWTLIQFVQKRFHIEAFLRRQTMIVSSRQHACVLSNIASSTARVRTFLRSGRPESHDLVTNGPLVQGPGGRRKPCTSALGAFRFLSSDVTLFSFTSTHFASHGHHQLRRFQGLASTAQPVVTIKLWRDTADDCLPRCPRRQPPTLLGPACLFPGPICLS